MAASHKPRESSISPELAKLHEMTTALHEGISSYHKIIPVSQLPVYEEQKEEEYKKQFGAEKLEAFHKENLRVSFMRQVLMQAAKPMEEKFGKAFAIKFVNELRDEVAVKVFKTAACDELSQVLAREVIRQQCCGVSEESKAFHNAQVIQLIMHQPDSKSVEPNKSVKPNHAVCLIGIDAAGKNEFKITTNPASLKALPDNWILCDPLLGQTFLANKFEENSLFNEYIKNCGLNLKDFYSLWGKGPVSLLDRSLRKNSLEEEARIIAEKIIPALNDFLTEKSESAINPTVLELLKYFKDFLPTPDAQLTVHTRPPSP